MGPAMTEAMVRLELCEFLLEDLSPGEVEFVREYARAAGDATDGGRALGPEFGVPEAAVLLGPVVVVIGQRVYDLVLEWVGNVAQKTVEGFIVDRGKEKLKAWLAAPRRNGIGDALTAEGKAELIGLVSRLAAEANLSPEESERVSRRVATLVLGGDGKQ